MNTGIFQAYLEEKAKSDGFSLYLQSKGLEQPTQDAYRDYIIIQRTAQGDPHFVNKGRYEQQRAAEREMLADFVADTVFRGEKAVQELVAVMERPDRMTFLQRLIGWIKALYNKVRGVNKGTDKELRRLRRDFERLLRKSRQTRENGKRETAENGNDTADFEENNTGNEENDTISAENVRYSLPGKAVEAVQAIGKKSINEFSSEDIKATEVFAKQYWREMGTKSPFFRAWFGDWRAYDTTPVEMARKKGDTRGNTKNADTGWDIQVSGKVFAESKHFADKNAFALPYLPYVNDIVEKAVLLDSYGMGKKKSSNSLLMHSLYVVADIGSGPELLKLYVEEMNDPNRSSTTKRAYQLQNIEKASVVNGGVQSTSPSSLANTTNAVRTVADLAAIVKSKDVNYSPKPVSKAVLNGDGTPKVWYHGTNAEFTEFQSADGNYWFSESSDYAEAMMEERGGNRIVEAYLHMGNPYITSLAADQFTNPVFESKILREAKAKGHDGVIIENETDNEMAYDVFAVAFNSTQIKSATDNIGTFDGSNPDIRYSLSEGEVDELLAQYNAGNISDEEMKRRLTGQKLQNPMEIAAAGRKGTACPT